MARPGVIANLKTSIEEEELAERRYRRRAMTADRATARLYRHIADEEHQHALEFKSRLKKIKEV